MWAPYLPQYVDTVSSRKYLTELYISHNNSLFFANSDNINMSVNANMLKEKLILHNKICFHVLMVRVATAYMYICVSRAR